MKLKREENPCPYFGEMRADERGKVEMPPKMRMTGIAPLDVNNNILTLGGVDKYVFKEIDGKVYRVNDKGLEYPPVSKEQFEAIKKLHKEYRGHEEEMEH